MADWNRIFPALETIEDRDLREKVEKVWEESRIRGGWKDGDLESIPFTLLVADAEINLFEHTRIVTDLCIKIAEAMQGMDGVAIDMDMLIAGALLHDVGKFLEYRKEQDGYAVARSGRLLRHPLSGMGLAMKEGLPEEVCHIIAVHSREGERSYRSPEAIILHHADFIMFETFKSVTEFPEMRR